MKVVLLVPEFPKLSETFIVSKFLGLLARGWDVQVLCGKSEARQWKQFPELERHPEARSRVKVNWLHRPRWLAALFAPVALLNCLIRNPEGVWSYLRVGVRRFGFTVLRQLYLDSGLVALKPDLVHFEFGALAVGRMYVKEALGCKTVVSFRGYDVNLSGLDQADYFAEVWNQADALHLLGEGVWQRAQQRGCPKTKPHVLIPPAIDTKFFESEKRTRVESAPETPLRILSVGRLTWEKGYEYAVEAVHHLAAQGVRSELRLIGAGIMLEPLAFARHQLGLKKSVHFLGEMPGMKVREEMLAADVFLHPSVSEGFGNAVLEAQAMALPVVCSDAGGLPENVADGETGFVVPRRDSLALAKKLALLARDPKLRQRMGNAGRQRMLGRFQLAEQLGAFDRLYHSVLS
jgi:colanic acid/amylovoran biosynthesis glycosyltransferase